MIRPWCKGQHVWPLRPTHYLGYVCTTCRKATQTKEEA